MSAPATKPTWRDVGQAMMLWVAALDGIEQGLAWPSKTPLMDIPRLWIALDQERAAEVDKAVEYYCANKTWPELDRVPSALLVHRITSAAYLVQSLHEEVGVMMGFVREPESFEDAFRWLLIRHWHAAGRDHWRVELERSIDWTLLVMEHAGFDRRKVFAG